MSRPRLSTIRIRDINDRSTSTEVLHVVEAEVHRRLNSGQSHSAAAKDVWDRVRDRTGKEFKQQSRVRTDI